MSDHHRRPSWHYAARLALISLMPLFSSVVAHQGVQQVMMEPPTHLANAGAAIRVLQQDYNQTTGLWDSIGWWNSANALVYIALARSSFMHGLTDEYE